MTIMELPNEKDRWPNEAVVRIIVTPRNMKTPVKEYLIGGDNAASLWSQFHAHLSNRIKDLLDMDCQPVNSFTLEDNETILLDELYSLVVEGPDGRTWELERYGGNLDFPTEPEFVSSYYSRESWRVKDEPPFPK